MGRGIMSCIMQRVLTMERSLGYIATWQKAKCRTVCMCYAPSPYLRTDWESKATTVLQTQEGSLFIPSVLGPKSHPTQGNLTRAPNKEVWRLIYRQFFVSVTGVAGITWLARQDERISCLFLVNMTQVLETVVWSLTVVLGLINFVAWQQLIFRFFSDFDSAILSEVLKTSYNCKTAVATSDIMFHTTKPFSEPFIRNKDNLPRSHSVDFSSHFTSQTHITCSVLNQCKGNGITTTVQD